MIQPLQIVLEDTDTGGLVTYDRYGERFSFQLEEWPFGFSEDETYEEGELEYLERFHAKAREIIGDPNVELFEWES